LQSCQSAIAASRLRSNAPYCSVPTNGWIAPAPTNASTWLGGPDPRFPSTHAISAHPPYQPSPDQSSTKATQQAHFQALATECTQSVLANQGKVFDCTSSFRCRSACDAQPATCRGTNMRWMRSMRKIQNSQEARALLYRAPIRSKRCRGVGPCESIPSSAGTTAAPPPATNAAMTALGKVSSSIAAMFPTERTNGISRLERKTHSHVSAARYASSKCARQQGPTIQKSGASAPRY
jgi:hypothetical protein